MREDTTPEEVTLVVRKALSAVARVHRRFGLQAAVRLLRGEADPRLERAGLDRTSTFGCLREHSEPWLMRVLRRCVTAGWVDLTSGDRPVVVLTDAGRSVMKAERPARLLLPARVSPATPRPARDRRPAVGRSAADPVAFQEIDAGLFAALRDHRLAVSRAQGVPPFVVASDRTLREITAVRPRTMEELMAVYGIGATKAARYGRGFLEVIARAVS
jgi:ATP-dependent DNA helicase RecQ